MRFSAIRQESRVTNTAPAREPVAVLEGVMGQESDRAAVRVADPEAVVTEGAEQGLVRQAPRRAAIPTF
jgi:hypothetical protein